MRIGGKGWLFLVFFAFSSQAELGRGTVAVDVAYGCGNPNINHD
jgi:hypothetical protein